MKCGKRNRFTNSAKMEGPWISETEGAPGNSNERETKWVSIRKFGSSMPNDKHCVQSPNFRFVE